MLKTLLITTGDLDGVGVEVAGKALQKVFPQLKCNIVVYLNKKSLLQFRSTCRRASISANDFSVIKNHMSDHARTPKIYLYVRSDSPAEWVFDAATIAVKNRKDFALVTGPISKQVVHKKYPGLLGHTDILKKVTANPKLHMGFLGTQFNVLLATGHIPIQKIETTLTKNRLKYSLQLAKKMMSFSSHKNKYIGVLGLNPHSGDDGLIGLFEKNTLIPVIKQMRSQKMRILGPLVPDVAFSSKNIKKVGIFLALYHDQGLIPFKYVHGQENGAHVTMGLSFIRTSVDHGTAKDIFKKNKANPNSMIDALVWGKKLLGAKL